MTYHSFGGNISEFLNETSESSAEMDVRNRDMSVIMLSNTEDPYDSEPL